MSSHGHSDDDHDFAHPLPLPLLFGTFVALVFLTIVTVWQANFNFGRFDIAIVMFIATIKAALVAFFFMHLAFDKPFNNAVFFSSFIFVGLFLLFTISDSQMTSGDMIPVVDEVATTPAEN